MRTNALAVFWLSMVHMLLVVPKNPAAAAESSISDQLELKYVSSFDWVWDDRGSGSIANGAIFRPKPATGFYPLAYLATGPYEYWPHELLSKRAVIVARSLVDGALKRPRAFRWIGDDHKSGAKGDVSWWQPIPEPGYHCLGSVFVPWHGEPPADSIMCVRADLTVPARGSRLLFSDKGSGGSHDLSLIEVTPFRDVGGLNVGAIVALPFHVVGEPPRHPDHKDLYTLAAFSRGTTKSPLSHQDIKDIIERQGPRVYFHPQEQFFPWSVEAFLDAAFLVKDQESYPVTAESFSKVLAALGNSSDLHLDLADPSLLRGDLETAKTYVSVQQVHDNFTDLQFRFFYAHNGKPFIRYQAYVHFLKRNFKRSPGMVNNGEHRGDWEQVTLRVAHDSKQVVAVGYTSHGDTVWYAGPERSQHVEVYSALHMHGSYPQARDFIELTALRALSKLDVGIFSDNKLGTAHVWPAYRSYEIVAADSIPSSNPDWLAYKGRWGPTQKQHDAIKFAIEGLTLYTFHFDGETSGPSTPSPFNYE